MLQSNRGIEVSPREYAGWQHEKEMLQLQIQHEQKIKELDLEVRKIEAQFASWLKLPITIIKLPVYVLLSIAYIVQSFKKEPKSVQQFWDFINH